MHVSILIQAPSNVHTEFPNVYLLDHLGNMEKKAIGNAIWSSIDALTTLQCKNSVRMKKSL